MTLKEFAELATFAISYFMLIVGLGVTIGILCS